MSTLRSLVEKHYQQINTQDNSTLLEVFSPDVETTAPGAGTMRGLEPFAAYGQAFYTAFPDGRIHLKTVVESGDTIMVEGNFTGTNTGRMAGPAGDIPPTGRQIDLPFCDVFQARDGRFMGHRLYFDQVIMLTQLGLMPAPPAA